MRKTTLVWLVALLLLVTACATAPAGTAVTAGAALPTSASPSQGASNGGATVLQVVAAENFWGSVARQLGGDRVGVTSIIANPAADPHDYEPTPADARLVASARYVIVNGAGYDPWATKLLTANPAANRKVLDVGALVGKKDGDNPHLWYSPDYVAKVVDQVAADLQALDPADAAYFNQRHSEFDAADLQTYHQHLGAIKQRYAGTPVGATESIFVYMADALGLQLISPPRFMQAISDGSEPTAADKAAFDQQIAQRQIKVLVYNKQNATPDTDVLIARAQAAGIPIVAITETLDPATASFQDWQDRQLQALQQALATATGR